jgi:1,4-alpha-glucan branching enzyme
MIGYFTFVLHSHLPYVLGYGLWPHGTDWLNEAVSETYIPLLNILNKLVEEGISPKITIGITPVLAEQLTSDEFTHELLKYLQNKIDAAIANQHEFKRFSQNHLYQLALFWQEYYTKIMADFKQRYNYNIIGEFRKLQDDGHIEIITSAATHGYLPLLSQDTSITAQIKQGILSYKRLFGITPKGFWLPECAYRPGYEWTPPVEITNYKLQLPNAYIRKGIDELLADEGIDYFIIDTHLLKGGKTIGVYAERFEALKRLWQRFEKEYQIKPEDIEKSPYTVYLLNSGKKLIAIFTRDPKTGLQVWSGQWGYPGDGWYLDFHKKHFPGGHRYWRVTSSKSDLADKFEYEPDKVEERIRENASHFKELVKSTLLDYYSHNQKSGIVVSPFDAELFGHWWFEGIRWLYYVLKWIEQDPDLSLTTCSEYLQHSPPEIVVSIPEGSWGEGGFHWIWLNEWTQWTWKYIYETEIIMQKLATEFINTSDETIQSILKQLAKQLLLLQASDWQFLISTWSARDYAEKRLVEHYEAFKRLEELLLKYTQNAHIEQGLWNFLEFTKKRDILFKDIDYKWWVKKKN